MKRLIAMLVGMILIGACTLVRAADPVPGTIPALGAATSIAPEDLLVVHKYPFTTSSTQKITWAQILANMGAVTVTSLTVSDVPNNNRVRISNNTSRSPAAGVWELYPESVWKVNTNGVESIMGHFVTTLPTSPTSSGVPGQMAMDSSYFYFCYGTNTWARIPKGAW